MDQILSIIITLIVLESSTEEGDSPVKKVINGFFWYPEYCLLDIRQEFGRHQLLTLNTT